MKTSLWRIIPAVIITFAAGFILKYFELNTYIVIIGFRFHIGAVLPFLFIARIPLLPNIKKEFVDPPFRRIFLFILIVFVPFLIGNGILYLLQLIHLGDPEYFYELGLSSIFDFPVYLIWNFPQFAMLYFFLLSAAESVKFKFVTVLLVTILLFGYEFIPLNKSIVNYLDIAAFGGIAILVSLLIVLYRNVYWFGITVFAVLWSVVLMAGSSSKGIINILLAAQYRNWEGMLEINKVLNNYYLPGYILLATLTALTGLGLAARKKTSS